MLRHFFRADFERRLHPLQAADKQSLRAQLGRQLARMIDQFGLRGFATRRIEPIGVAHAAVVDIGHRRELAAVKKTAHKNKWRRGDRTAVPVLR